MITQSLVTHRKPYAVHRRGVSSVIWFRSVYEIVYDDDTVVYNTRNKEVADTVCVIMNNAHRVGFYDGISAAILNVDTTVSNAD